MADLSDVEAALVQAVAAILYPAGGNGASAAGPVVQIMRGWPNSQQLDPVLAASNVMVSVGPLNGFTRLTTRYPVQWETVSTAAPSLFTRQNGNVVSFAGTGSAGQIVGISQGGSGWTHVCQATETAAQVAAALAAVIPGATSDINANLKLPAGPMPAVGCVGIGTAQRVTRTQEQGMQITVWCPDPTTRDTLASMIDAALSTVLFFTLADGTRAWLRYVRPVTNDYAEKANLWRRDLHYRVEYSTTQTIVAPEMALGIVQLNGADFAITADPPAVAPLIGAIRFDGWYGASNVAGSIEAQNAAVLSPTAYNNRLPWFATPPAAPIASLPNPYTGAASVNLASWPQATQAIIDQEIALAAFGQLDFFAFDSYQPTSSMSLALNLFLSSKSNPGTTGQKTIMFAMIGQYSNWNQDGTSTWTEPYSSALQRDIGAFANPLYVRVLGNRPLYFVLNLDTGASGTAAVAYIRAQSIASGSGDPYIVALNGASIGQYNTVTLVAQPTGCDAAGAYDAGVDLSGTRLPYDYLRETAELDWEARALAGFPMVPTAMLGFAPDPLIATPVPYYSIPSGWFVGNDYMTGNAAEIGSHIATMRAFIQGQPWCACNVGLINAWNEFAESGLGLMPTYVPGNAGGDLSRLSAASLALSGKTPASSIFPELI